MARPTSTPFSQADFLFQSYLGQLPEALRDALITKKLADPGILRAYPRFTLEQLGLQRTIARESTATWSTAGGGVTDDGISTPVECTDDPLTLATPPTSSFTQQHTGEQSTTHRDARPITDTAMTTTTPPHAPVVPEVGVRRKRVGKLLSVNTLRGESSSLVKPMNVPSRATIERKSKKLTDSPHETEPASFLQGNHDDLASHSAISWADSSRRKSEDVVMGAVSSSILNESTDGRVSQDGEQNDDGFPIDLHMDGNRLKSELMDASTELSMIGKKPDDPIGSLGERLRHDPSQAYGEAPNDHASRPTHENLFPPNLVIQRELKDARSSQDRETIVDDIIILYHTLVKDKALPTGYEKEFSSLGPVLRDAAHRQLRNNAAIENEQAAVFLHDFHRQQKKSSETAKSAVEQFVAAARDRPRTYRTRLQKMLYSGPTPREDAEEMERARWVEAWSTLLRATETPMGKMLVEKPHTAQLLGAGRRVTTLRSRVRLARRYLAWLSINFEVLFPTKLEHMVDYFKVRASEPCTRGTLKNTHRSLLLLP